MTQLAGIATERRRAEDALRASEAKFRGLFKNVMEGVYQTSREGRFLSVNPAFVQSPRLRFGGGLYALPDAASLYVDPADREEFITGASTRTARSTTLNIRCGGATVEPSWCSKVRAWCAMSSATSWVTERYDRRYHGALEG